MVKSRNQTKNKGISTFIATLLLMVLVVAAGVTIYAYMMGYLGGFTGGGGNNYQNIQIQSVAEVPVAGQLELWIYVKNTGRGSVNLDLNQNARLYINNDPRGFNIDNTVILEGETFKVSTSVPPEWSGETINIKIVASGGPFSNTLYKVSGSMPILDHFDFATITNPRTAGKSFTIMITAKDSTGDIVPSYTGSNTLASSVGLIDSTISPFAAGVWTSDVVLSESGSSVTISTSGGGKSGISNSFTVDKARPMISTILTPIPPALGEKVTVSTELSGATSTASGLVTCTLYSGIYPNGVQIDTDTEEVLSRVILNLEFNIPSSGQFYFEAVYSGDSNNNGVTETAKFIVDKALSTTTTTVSESLITSGNQVTDTVTVIGVSPIPTGTISFQVKVDASSWTTYSSVTLDLNGQATSTDYKPMTADTYYFRAQYSGDSNYQPSDSPDFVDRLIVKPIP